MTISMPADEIVRCVLGIDAAWTPHNPSGVALAVETARGWRLASVWPDYSGFLGACPPAGDLPRQLILRVCEMTGLRPALIAVDMPMSRLPIIARRAADTAVSRAYGGRGAATHSPSAVRPGAVADRLRAGFAAEGAALRTLAEPDGALAEVYPHPALIELMGSARRLPYKIARIRRYWPDLTPAHRRDRLINEWCSILGVLDLHLPGCSLVLTPPPPMAPVAVLKSFEDQLDAIICSVVAIEILAGRAVAFGDGNSAIWIPASANHRLR